MFEAKLWDDFDQKTAGGRAPYLFESILPIHKGFSGPEVVEQAFYDLAEQSDRKTTDSRIRIYDGEQRRDDLIEQAYRQLRLNGETLVAFMQRLTARTRFSLVINNLEQISPRLAAAFGRFIRSFFAFRGMPVGGVEQAAFCGNYAGTAFGIHEGFEHAFLCHLGPGVKEFYCWTRDEYIALAGGRAPTFAGASAYDVLLKTGKLFLLKPGDVLYLPASVYHIGRQDEYSVSVALPFYTYPLTRFLSRRVIPELSEQSLAFDQEGISDLLPFGNRNPLLVPLGQLLDDNLRRWSDGALHEYLGYHWHRLISNGGWELPRRISAKVCEEGPLQEPLPIQIGQRIRLREPLHVSHQAALGCSAAQRRVFAGARSVVIDDPHARQVAWLEQLNSYDSVPVETEQQREACRALSRTGSLELV